MLLAAENQMRMGKRSRSSSGESHRRKRESPATQRKGEKRERSKEASEETGDVRQEKTKQIKSTVGTDGRVLTSTVVDADVVISDEEMEAVMLLDNEHQEGGGFGCGPGLLRDQSERNGNVIAAEGEKTASESLRMAAVILSGAPAAALLRYLRALHSLAAGKPAAFILPLPLDPTNLVSPAIRSPPGVSSVITDTTEVPESVKDKKDSPVL